MSTVGTAIATTEIVSACLRPRRSPIWPNSSAPIGRIRKPAAKTPNASISDVALLCDGKKFSPIA